MAKKKKSDRMLVVQSAVRDHVRDKGMRVGSDFLDRLSEEVEGLVDRAMDRAEDNKRQTLYAGDL